MNPGTRTLLALALAAGLAAGCQDASTPEPEPAESEPALEDSAELPARSSAEVWSAMRVEWDAILELASARTKSIEQFEQMEAALARLTENTAELERSLDMTGRDLLETGRSILVLRGSMLDLERTLRGRIPGQLPEATNLVASQLWVVQERFPPGSLPGEPLPKPKGIGMPSS